MPSISPNTPASAPYVVGDSKALVVNSQLDFNNVPRFFTVSYPDPAPAGLALELVQVASSSTKDLVAAPAGTPDTTTFPGRRVIVTRSTNGTVITLRCEIHDPDENGVLDEHYELRASATDPITWGYGVDNNTNSSVVRVVCDPVAAFTGLPANVLEKEPLTLNAAPGAGEVGTPTVVRYTNPADGPVLPAPVPTYFFRHTGPLAIAGLPQNLPSTSQSYQLVDPFGNPVPLPGVYAPTNVPFVVDVNHTGVGPAGFLTRSGTQVAAIGARPQRVQLILDRSGSMSAEHRWDNAKTAARIFVNFFGEFRAGVNTEDRIGITVFEDHLGGFRDADPSPPPFVTDVVPLNSPGAVADGDLGPAVFGNPGGATNIGDGLFFALRKLQEAGFPQDVRFTAVLMTDGNENSGVIKIGSPEPPIGPGNPKSWTAAKLDPAINVITGPSKVLEIFAIGLGSAPNFGVLSGLVNAAHFAAALDVGQLIDFYATMFTNGQEANKLDTRFTQQVGGPVPANPTEIFFDTTAAQRFGVAVLKELDPATPADVIDTVEIARLVGAAFQVEGKIQPQDFEGHIYLGVSDTTEFNNGSATWRIRRFNGTTVKPIGLQDVFAFEDLHVKSVLSLDKKDYLTGEPMRVAVEIRNDGAPVLGAIVRAELDAPAESVGSLIATLEPDDIDRQQRHGGEDKDRPHGRAAQIEAILRKYDWHGLPRTNPDPGGLFEDGSNLLHDRDGDGIYTNTFRKVNAEGVYNWTLFAGGEDGEGNPFNHRLDRSTLAEIGISKRHTVVRRDSVQAPQGKRAVKVTITPRDSFKNLLGPGHDETVIWALDDGGVFEHVANRTAPPVNTDGTYTRTVIFRHGQRPTLRVSVNGVILPKIRLTDGH